MLGKNIKRPFPKSEDKSNGTLDLVHSNVCGPMSVQSFSGYSYCVTFIDDYSKKTWIYFLKAKSEVFDRFREFKTLVENQTGRKIWVLRTDNGGEYTSKEFLGFVYRRGSKRSTQCLIPRSKDVHLYEDRALRRSMDLPTQEQPT